MPQPPRWIHHLQFYIHLWGPMILDEIEMEEYHWLLLEKLLTALLMVG